MSDTSDLETPLSREAASELRSLVVLLESLRARFVNEAAAAAAVEDLADALDEVGRIEQRLLERASYFERLAAEERRRYHDLFDRAPDAYIVTSTDGLILHANAAAAELLERPPRDLLGRPLDVFVPRQDRRELRRRLLQIVQRPIDMFELELQVRSGVRRIEARASAELFEAAPAQIRWILRDVTARKHAEAEVNALNVELEQRVAERTRELTKTGERLESVLQEMPQGVLIVDTSGTVQMVNRRAEELAGMPASQLTEVSPDEPWRMFARDGRELEWHERPLVRALETEEATLNERVHVERRDGARFFFDVSATPVHGPEGLHSVILTFQDVTAQELRERAERDFVTNAAHELQTPLAAITSAIEVLQSGAKDQLEDRERFLAHIQHASERLSRLTHALLVLARAQTGAERPRRTVIPVQPLLEDVAAGLPRERDVAIECEPGAAVIGNRPLLEQALLNLAQNAIKHTRGNIEMRASTHNGRVTIVVRDVGPGIADEDRERVFQRFYRNGTADHEGFGLGLSIVAEVARALDGELELDSSATGTSIALSLPAARIVPH